MPANELLNILNKQWANTNDVCSIGNIGKSSALKVMKNIKEKLLQEGYRLPKSNLVPMEKVVEYFNININYLKKITK